MVVGPWLTPEASNQQFAALIRGILTHREEFAGQYRWTPFPLKYHWQGFGPAARPLPVGALLRLWEALPEFRGSCRCGGGVLAYTVGGHWPGVGGLYGVCLKCGMECFRGIGGDGAFRGLIAPVLDVTEFWVADEFDRDAWDGCERALPAALAELGATAVSCER